MSSVECHAPIDSASAPVSARVVLSLKCSRQRQRECPARGSFHLGPSNDVTSRMAGIEQAADQVHDQDLVSAQAQSEQETRERVGEPGLDVAAGPSPFEQARDGVEQTVENVGSALYSEIGSQGIAAG